MDSAMESCIMVIFGATGDLTHRKLMPALYYLEKQCKLPERFSVIAVGRRDKTTKIYLDEIKKSIAANISEEIDDKALNLIAQKTIYHRQDLSDPEGYRELKDRINKIGEDSNILYYLAVAPQFFDIIVEGLAQNDMAYKQTPWRKIMIEKPFGRDLASAEALNKRITKAFPESSIYRIDHYLGKEMLQNLITIRFANAVFEPVWNRNYIDNIQISSCENLGVEARGGYYEQSGILRDMVQNHMLQLLTLTAMEPPKSFDEKHVRDSKLDVLKSIIESFDSVETVCGQYGEGEIDKKKVVGYRQEENVYDNSKVATFAAIKLHIDNERWKGVPFYIRTGKRMPKKTMEVVIQFKNDLQYVDYENSDKLKPNLLIIKIHPEEGVEFIFNAKVPRTINDFAQVKMDFCQNCQMGMSSPEAYERLLNDTMRGDATLFTRWDEVKHSWIFTDMIREIWEGQDLEFPNYAAGTWGPREAHDLLEKDGRKWWIGDEEKDIILK